MTTLALNGQWQEANALQLKYLPFIQALFSETSPIPAKTALAMMGKMTGEMRLPLVPMTDGNKQKMTAIMQELGLIK